jgi:hypothetical protein
MACIASALSISSYSPDDELPACISSRISGISSGVLVSRITKPSQRRCVRLSSPGTCRNTFPVPFFERFESARCLVSSFRSVFERCAGRLRDSRSSTVACRVCVSVFQPRSRLQELLSQSHGLNFAAFAGLAPRMNQDERPCVLPREMYRVVQNLLATL